MSSPPCGNVRGQSSSLVWNVRGPCCVSTRQRRISTSSSISSTRVTSNTNPATASAISSAARERGSSSSGTPARDDVRAPTRGNSAAPIPAAPRPLSSPTVSRRSAIPTSAYRASVVPAADGPTVLHPWSLLSLKLQLQLVQVPVLPVGFRQQLRMGAVLDQPAVLDHEQARRLAERRQPG